MACNCISSQIGTRVFVSFVLFFYENLPLACTWSTSLPEPVDEPRHTQKSSKESSLLSQLQFLFCFVFSFVFFFLSHGKGANAERCERSMSPNDQPQPRKNIDVSAAFTFISMFLRHYFPASVTWASQIRATCFIFTEMLTSVLLLRNDFSSDQTDQTDVV